MGSERAAHRIAFWKLIDQVIEGVNPATARLLKDHGKPHLLTGMVQEHPSLLACGPLMARTQPLTLVLSTAGGAEVVAVLTQGLFVREPHLPEWPVGFTGPDVAGIGSGKGLYATAVRRYPAGTGTRLLTALAEGAGRLIDYLTDPAWWIDDDGVLDSDERWITWSSALLGFEMVRSLASEWGHSSTMWTALNALGILQGIWQSGSNEPQLSALLDPQHIRDHAIAPYPDDTYRQWLSGVIDNYEQRMRTLDPASAADDLIAKFADLRNLVHGVGGRKKKRAERLRTLERLGRSSINMTLVADVAAVWWGAAVLNPHTVLRPGRPPWAV